MTDLATRLRDRALAELADDWGDWPTARLLHTAADALDAADRHLRNRCDCYTQGEHDWTVGERAPC